MKKAIEMVIAERERQNAKWGDQSGNHPFEWMSIIGEEFGELCEAVNETCFKNPTHPERGGNARILREAVHVAAVAVAIAEAASKGEEPDLERGRCVVLPADIGDTVVTGDGQDMRFYSVTGYACGVCEPLTITCVGIGEGYEGDIEEFEADEFGETVHRVHIGVDLSTQPPEELPFVTEPMGQEEKE